MNRHRWVYDSTGTEHVAQVTKRCVICGKKRIRTLEGEMTTEEVQQLALRDNAEDDAVPCPGNMN